MKLLVKFHKYDIILPVGGKHDFDHEFEDSSDSYRSSEAASDKLPDKEK